MPVKIKYIFVTMLLAATLFACHSVHNYLQPSVERKTFQEPVRPTYPALLANIPALPANKPFHWTLPVLQIEEVKIPAYPRVDITDVFCKRDIDHISTSDPKLFAESDKLYIDLLKFQQGDYSFPLPGAKLLSPFRGRRKNHAGVDLKTFANDTIRAVFDGVVRMAKEYAGYGKVIVVRHYNGLETVYSHNSKHLIAQGALVKPGQPIALVGRTGRATTEHLHFETRINGRPFNPALLFDLSTGYLHNDILVCTKKNNQVEVVSVQRFPPYIASYSK